MNDTRKRVALKAASFYWGKSYLRRIKFTTAIAAALLFVACRPVTDSQNQALQTTISEDGMLVAALTHGRSSKQLLRVRNLRDDKQWTTIDAPANLKTIRFGRSGHELLVTYWDTKKNTSVLAKIDLKATNKNALPIYEALDLGFPIEIENGTIMVRSSEPLVDGSMKPTIPKKRWLLIDKELRVDKIGPPDMLPFSTPNILNGGYFWVEQQTSKNNPAVHPKLWSYAFPQGVAPNFDVTRFDKSTANVICDRLARRCLRSFLDGQDINRQYVYDVDVNLESKNCKISSIKGVPQRISITPDGLAAVMSFSDTHDGIKHVAALAFHPQQCEPISVRHLHFEEK